MSRGLGLSQRRVLEVLNEVPANGGLSVTELKIHVGRNRSNTRRAIRTLALQGLVEETTVGGERHVRLTFRGALKAMPPLPEVSDPLAELRALREAQEQLRDIIKERAEERARLKAQKDALWIRYVHHPVRRRQPGPTQKQVLAILWEYADPTDEGLPIRVVKAIVAGDRANTRRAIRSLLLRGEIEESKDGRSIRLASGTALWFSIMPPFLLEPIDEERARAILQAFRAPQVVA